MLEFDRVRPIEELGYAQASERLRGWLESGGLRDAGRL
jgi:hypothetical protein